MNTQLIKALTPSILAFLAGQALAEERVYLLAVAQLQGGSYAQGLFLHEPAITTLQGCEQARLQGQRDRDWLQYHHILMKERMQGYTVQMHYRCVLGEQQFDGWYDKARYDHAYEVRVDASARLRVRPAASLAECSTWLKQHPASGGETAFCAKSSQALLQSDSVTQ